MTVFADIMLLGWIPMALVLFYVWPTQRAIVGSTIIGWLFLPNAAYELPGFPDFTKTNATILAAFLGALVFQPQPLLRLRPCRWDLPVAVMCFCPALSSLANDLGGYEAMSSSLAATVTWGLPYILGRAFFNNMNALKELAIGIMIGGIVYVPLCLWEIRMSPQLHYDFYGFRTQLFAYGSRFGGYRPSVFMWTYLPVVMWLSMSVIICFQFWSFKSIRRMFHIPIGLHLIALLVTLFLCKQFIAAILVPSGIGILWVAKRHRVTLPYVILLLGIPFIMGLRATGAWSARSFLDVVSEISAERAQSLEFRLINEDEMAAQARLRPVFGWGGFGRNRVVDEEGRDQSITDGLWIIEFGTHGMLGLLGLIGLFFFPLFRLWQRSSKADWRNKQLMPAATCAVCVLMVFLFNIPNASDNPIVTLMIGGLALLRRPAT